VSIALDRISLFLEVAFMNEMWYRAIQFMFVFLGLSISCHISAENWKMFGENLMLSKLHSY